MCNVCIRFLNNNKKPHLLFSLARNMCVKCLHFSNTIWISVFVLSFGLCCRCCYSFFVLRALYVCECVCICCLFISFVRFWFDLNSACYFMPYLLCSVIMMHLRVQLIRKCTKNERQRYHIANLRKICIDFFLLFILSLSISHNNSLSISFYTIWTFFRILSRSIISTQCLTGCNEIKIKCCLYWICVLCESHSNLSHPNDSCEFCFAFSHHAALCCWIYSIKLWRILRSSFESCKYCAPLLFGLSLSLSVSWPHDFISPEMDFFLWHINRASWVLNDNAHCIWIVYLSLHKRAVYLIFNLNWIAISEF